MYSLECNEGVCSGLYTDITAVPKDTDCIIVLGGDGTYCRLHMT